jgi:hypothetical protein
MCVTVAQRTLVTGFLPGTAPSRLAGVVALVVVAALGGMLDPVACTAVTTAVLVGLVVFKLWAAQHVLATSWSSAAVPVAEA